MNEDQENHILEHFLSLFRWIPISTVIKRRPPGCRLLRIIGRYSTPLAFCDVTLLKRIFKGFFMFLR